ncbi:hypothetical protein SADUNF_Sadunf03G0103400 [Salix dunnii]|uniref:Uncharacterized protein n=1 Tax=Salix dunnii TaxID=1413687 RepID=A0A835KCF3_9ROSI|nr:hypothetical protein SADUNF_Sadunf03G0103400 [Salix dunnii]
MEEKRKAEQSAVDAWDWGSPLYDSYEIASLGHVIDRHSLALPFPSGPDEEGRHVIQYSSTPRDQEKGLEVKEEGVLFKMIRVFFWKRKTTSIKGRNDKSTEPVRKVRDHAAKCKKPFGKTLASPERLQVDRIM